MPKEKRIKKLIERVLGGDKEAKEDLILDLPTPEAERAEEQLKRMEEDLKRMLAIEYSPEERKKENIELRDALRTEHPSMDMSPEERKKQAIELRDALYKKIMEEKEK